MQDISMYCPKCEIYTKDYEYGGVCLVCGTEVITGLHDHVDIGFEGYIEEQKDGTYKYVNIK